MEVHVYLNFPGNAEEAFNFYKSIFGGEFTALQRTDTAPGTENLPKDLQQKIMHVALPIGKNLILMATDSLEEMGHKSQPGNNFTLSISPGSEDEMYKIFNALAEGGKIGAPVEKMFWGAWWGMLFDKFGIQWMINYDPNQPK